ncbi:MAG: hypothetical protein A2W98_14235 [Bacteroidetes bacterium GWF2_33_38]|nr:MAG: hypothetical protein A2W98_14235 [Bacteroidetes bacterium GWF2_33_38]OFY69337.1 MAG: hypothetical protein A2265_05945 [Bacteroidetes bacterium RIFOXYA12_FULL_33_9]OFY85335.1 MAG: hypothetical protein A2236_06835 [Bacteroidetes bacterium RIFOXYA2_FULL_33_7]
MYLKSGENKSFATFMKPFQQKIRNFDGCIHHDIFPDKENDDIFYSYTIWKSESKVKKYRNSDLIKHISEAVMPKCTKEPIAWTVDEVFEK